jgi:SAM-dependent methyltransferase
MDAPNGPPDYSTVADFYDEVVPYRDRPDIAFYVEFAREAGGPVLEVGSGTGRVLLPVARAGVEIVGVDSSPEMLAVCRRRLAEEPEDVRARVRLVQGDMRDLDLGETFPRITTPFRPFQHMLAVDDQLAALATFHRHLDAGGLLVLDLFNPALEVLVNAPIGEETSHEPELTLLDGRRVVRCHKMLRIDRAEQVTYSELVHHITHPDGRTERLVQPISMRYLFRYEVEHLLARAGFTVEALHGSFDRSPFTGKDSPELIFIARKR